MGSEGDVGPISSAERELIGGAAISQYRAAMRYLEHLEQLSDPPTVDEMTELLRLVREQKAACLEVVRLCDEEISWGEPILRAHQQAVLRDSRAQQQADAAVAKLDRILKKSRRRGLETGHVCDNTQCSRNARFFTSTGNWCKRHVPAEERPKGKIT